MQAPPPSPEAAPRRRWRRVVFSLVPVLALLGLVELGGRALWGQPPPYDLVQRANQCRLELREEEAVEICEPGGRELVRARSRPERTRVVMLGGSSLRPNELDRDTVPAALAALLPEVEVLNLAAPGLGAAGVARLSSELESLDPDLVVIYSGHNDYNGDVFFGGIGGTRLWLMPVYRLLQASWTHALVARPTRGRPPQRGVQDYVNAVEGDQPQQHRAALDARFRYDLASAVRQSPAPVLLATLLRNPESPPTGVEVAGHPGCEAELRKLAATRPHDLERAVARSEALCGDGALSAWLGFRLALQQGDEERAGALWRRSLDEDRLPLRAPSSADPIIREVAAETGATLVDPEAEWGMRAPGRWFTDPLHLSPEGARALAAELEPAVRAALGLPAR